MTGTYTKRTIYTVDCTDRKTDRYDTARVFYDRTPLRYTKRYTVVAAVVLLWSNYNLHYNYLSLGAINSLIDYYKYLTLLHYNIYFYAIVKQQ